MLDPSFSATLDNYSFEPRGIAESQHPHIALCTRWTNKSRSHKMFAPTVPYSPAGFRFSSSSTTITTTAYYSRCHLVAGFGTPSNHTSSTVHLQHFSRFSAPFQRPLNLEISLKAMEEGETRPLVVGEQSSCRNINDKARRAFSDLALRKACWWLLVHILLLQRATFAD